MGKTERMKRFSAGLVAIFAAQFVVSAFIGVVLSVSSVAASDLSRSFNSDQTFDYGSLVSLDATKEGYVIGANTDNAEKLAGVAVLADNSLLAVNAGDSKAQVAISGVADTLVSDLNGDIKPGDMIAATAFTGIGAKALPGDRVVGVAQSGFNKDSVILKKTTITNLQGQSRELLIGTIPVVISIGSKLNDSAVAGASAGLQGFAANIAGRPVSVARIAIALVIGLAAVVSLIVVVYGTIRNGITAVARNPLAKPAIFDSMAQVMVMIAFIAVVSVVLMYAVLRI